MIRPMTLLCLLLAAASGLYLYQAKQQARLLDRQIRQVQDRIDETRSRSNVLRAEYTLLNDPDRLATLVATHLTDLKPTQPAQWTSMAELDKRLPPVGGASAEPAPLEPQDPSPAPEQPASEPPVAAAEPPTTLPPPRAEPTAPPSPRPVLARAVPPPVAKAAPRAVSAPPREPAVIASAPKPVRVGIVAASLPSPTPLRVANRPSTPATAGQPASASALASPVVPARAVAPEPQAVRVPVVASALGMARLPMPALTPAGPYPVPTGATR